MPAPRPVKLGPLANDLVITDGLKYGDRVIVDGLQKDPARAKVKPVRAGARPTATRTAAPPAGGGANARYFFIDRPIFAWVIALTIRARRAAGVRTLPVEQYPSIAPPSISINVVYPGADAAAVEENVTSIIERE